MRAVRTALVAALALGLIALFLRNADLTRVWAEMRTARLDLLGLAVALTVLTFLVRAERWQYLLEPLGNTRFSVAFRTTVIGFAASAVLPARAGEVLRPYLLARQEGLPVTATFATIVVERILDLIAVLLLLAVYLLFFDEGVAGRSPALYQAITVGAAIATPAALGVLVLMVLLAGHPERLQHWMLTAERVLPVRLARALARLAGTFAEGLAVVRRPSRLLASLGWSMVLWVVIVTETWVVARAFGIAMPYAGAYLLTSLLVVGIALPTPGGVGGFHEAFRLGTTAFFGANNDRAVGAAIVLHAASFVPVLLMGSWFAARDGLRLGELRKVAGEEARATSSRTPSAAPTTPPEPTSLRDPA